MSTYLISKIKTILEWGSIRQTVGLIMSNGQTRKRSNQATEVSWSEVNQKKTSVKTVLKGSKPGSRKRSSRGKQIRFSRDVKVKYYRKYPMGMKSTLVETLYPLFQSNYKTYIRRILKHLHRNMQISKESLDEINGFMNYLFHALACEASQRARRRGLKTITGREVQDVIKSRFPGNIKIFAVLNGIETLDKYIRNNESQ